MKKGLLIFGCIVLYKLMRNLVFFIRMRTYYKIYNEWEKNSNIRHTFINYEMRSASLMKRAGIKYPMEVAPKLSANVVQILPSIMPPDIKQHKAICKAFSNSIEIYLSRIVESFSPFYWIELVVFAPTNLIEYIGFIPEKSTVKILNILLLIVWWGILLFFCCFKEQIVSWGMHIFS